MIKSFAWWLFERQSLYDFEIIYKYTAGRQLERAAEKKWCPNEMNQKDELRINLPADQAGKRLKVD